MDYKWENATIVWRDRHFRVIIHTRASCTRLCAHLAENSIGRNRSIAEEFDGLIACNGLKSATSIAWISKHFN